jgi:hypothetical protein
MSVYFIKPIGFDGPIKIGSSIHPEGRRQTLECWSPFPLQIVAEIEVDCELERRFHALFFDQHKGREWFEVTPELLSVIEQVQAGTFDVDTLPAPKHLLSGTGCNYSAVGRRRMSYANRVWRVRRKTGFLPPIEIYQAETDADFAALDAYLAAPEVHGRARSQRAAA